MMEKKQDKKQDNYAIINKLRRRYILALGIIVAILIISQGIIQFSVLAQSGDSRIVNIAGRQRMLSQKISKCVLEINFLQDPVERSKAVEELDKAVELWEKSNIGLKLGDVELGLPVIKSKEALYMFDVIDKNFQTILDSSKKISSMVKSGVIDRNVLDIHLNKILYNEKVFLAGMDKIVFQFDKEASDRVSFEGSTEIILFIFVLVALTLETLFIFKPAENEIKNTLDLLKINEGKLERLATIDEMTGLINRNTGTAILQKEIELCKRDLMELSLCFLDLDGLKLINDEFGHVEGDWFIKTVAAVLIKNARQQDTIFRYGGDEIIIIFPQCSEAEGNVIMERIRKEVDEINSSSGKPYSIGLSYGISSYTSELDIPVEILINNADEIMYKMKSEKTSRK